MIRWTIVLLAIALTAVLGLLLVTYDFGMLTQLSSEIVVILVLLSLLYSYLYGFGVTLILRSLEFERSTWRVFLVISSGGTASYLGNIQLGIPLRLVLFNKLLGMSYPVGAASIALESACWFGLMGVALLVAGTASNFAPWIAVSVIAVCVFVGYRYSLTIAAHLLALLPAKWRGLPLAGVKSLLFDLVHALSMVRWAWLAAALLVFCINYAIDAATILMVASNYGEKISIWSALEAVILSYLVGLMSMVPMGLGVRDVSMVALLTHAGLSSDVATTVTLVQRILRTALPLAIGIFAINALGVKALLQQASESPR